MITDDFEREQETRARQPMEQGDQSETLGRQLADLYNENTLLRERVRVLEGLMRGASKPG